MTNAELIEELKRLPGHLHVRVQADVQEDDSNPRSQFYLGWVAVTAAELSNDTSNRRGAGGNFIAIRSAE